MLSQSLANRFDRVVDKAIDNTLSELADNCSSLQHDDAAFHVASDISARPALESILQKIEQFEVYSCLLTMSGRGALCWASECGVVCLPF